MITVNNLVHHEFIGLSVSVTSVSNESLRLKGTVIDETKNTIKIEVDDNVEKIIPKKGSIFVFELPTGEKVEINELSDDEVYALDLLEKVGSDNITDEELQQAIDTAKQNEDLYKKTVEGLRQEYIRLQQDKEAQQQNEIAARQQAQFQQFATSINSEISRMNNFMGQELELSPDEKEELSEFMLDLDEQGVSAFGRAMQDPEVFTQAAFWLLNQDKISEEITKQMQETYKRGYEQAKKDLGKSTSKFVFKPQNKTPDKYVDELSW